MLVVNRSDHMSEFFANVTKLPLKAEADHRIANNLTMLSGLMRMHAAEARKRGIPLSGAQVCTLLQELSLRVQTIARLHSALAKNPNRDRINLDEFIREICEGVSSLSSTSEVLLQIECQRGHQLESAVALPIGLIAAEMMTNAIKYAHPTGIRLLLNVKLNETEDGSICVEITDDGVGLPEGFDPLKHGGLGFSIMRSLADQIGAELQVEHDSLGTRCKILVPTRRYQALSGWPIARLGTQ
jgi:two-component sensor histidine kinase